jgi:hypothetical protein
MTTVKITAAFYEGDRFEGEYDVHLDGARIGRVVRHDGTPNGYYGRWSAHGRNLGRYYTDTRADAVDHLVAAAQS